MGVRDYGDGLRWQRFEQAASRLPNDKRVEFLDIQDEHEEDLRVDDYEVTRMKGGTDGKAIVSVRWMWHSDRKGIVHKTMTKQTWAKHGKRWIMTDEEHLKGEEIPGLPLWAELDSDEVIDSPEASTSVLDAQDEAEHPEG